MREGAELRSRAIHNTREPEWGGEEFAFLVHEPVHQCLHLVMWDADKVGKDEEVGWWAFLAGWCSNIKLQKPCASRGA